MVEHAKQKIEATLELAVSKVINSVPGIPPKSEYGAAAHQYMSSNVHLPRSRRSISPSFDNLRDEVDAITRWWSK